MSNAKKLSKIGIKPPIGTFAQPDTRFPHIYIGFIGPLPPPDGNQYCMATKWSEVIPTTDMTLETATHALVHGWISRFGSSVTVTTDQGRQFESTPVC